MIKVTIQSPAQCLYRGSANSISVVGSVNGGLQILSGHAPLIYHIIQGKILLKIQQKKKVIPIAKGIINFQNDEAIVLVS